MVFRRRESAEVAAWLIKAEEGERDSVAGDGGSEKEEKGGMAKENMEAGGQAAGVALDVSWL
jgi:hypothetical protein